MKTRKWMALTAVSFAALVPLAGFAAGPGGHVDIRSVVVNDPAGSITIEGADLNFGGKPVVTLGFYAPLAVTSYTAAKIVATCPVAACAMPEGGYRLVVSTGNGQSQADDYDITVGATGLQGPAGDKGPTGDKGPPGDKGAVGDKGPGGDKGAPGDKGIAGDKGAPGDKGVTGDKGPVGDKGPAGDEGVEGDKGAPGDKGPTGDKGATGDQGPSGPAGPPGPAGPAGSACTLGAVNSTVVTLICGGTSILLQPASTAPFACSSRPDLWMPVTSGGALWVWSSERTVGSNVATADANRILYTGDQHTIIPNTSSLDGTGWVSTQVFTMNGCNTTWNHLVASGNAGACGGHDGDQVRRLVMDANACFDYRIYTNNGGPGLPH